jgi:hypothetical protein
VLYTTSIFSSIGSENGLDMYLSPDTWVRFRRKTKNSNSEGVGEDREVAVRTTYVGGARVVTHYLRIQNKSNTSASPEQCTKKNTKTVHLRLADTKTPSELRNRPIPSDLIQTSAPRITPNTPLELQKPNHNSRSTAGAGKARKQQKEETQKQ